ncbi:SDR family NAD(P)-dependent oxidoreductase [Myxococcota bacterium]|nr:SDR family NAD(P)-dependent oxidoreductase [Myxococcota bacterium]
MEFRNRAAVITGAASGIGFGLAEAAADRGMSVVLADVEAQALARAEAAIEARGVKTLAVVTDVSSAASVDALADRAFEAFGEIGLLCNNAGVSLGVTQRIWELDRKDWEWLLGVNLWGVVHGLQAFLPRLMKQASPAHILNTASAAALIAGPVLGPYKASKHAVLSLSETLFHDLRGTGSQIGVSVFCPDVVATRLREADRNRPTHLRLGQAAPASAEEQAFSSEWQKARGLAPRDAAEIAFRGIEAGRFYLFTDPWALGAARERVEDFEAGIPRETVLRDASPPVAGR